MPVALTAHIFTQLIEALAYLHHGVILDHKGKILRKHLSETPHPWRPIIHNDVRPENILLRWRIKPVARNNTTNHYPDIVLANFDVAGDEGRVFGPRGSYRYSAPEVREAYNLVQTWSYIFDYSVASQINRTVVCTPKSDIWSLGMVMEDLIFASSRLDARVVGQFCGYAVDWAQMEMVYTVALVTWVRRCLGSTPLGRPSSRRLLSHAVAEVEEAVGAVGTVGRSQELPFWVRVE